MSTKLKVKTKIKTKLYINRVRINYQGYDPSGSYWGIGKPLYFYEFELGDDYICDYIRAYDREDAKNRILSKHPELTEVETSNTEVVSIT